MSLTYNCSILNKDNLKIFLDPYNVTSYPGSGTNFYNLMDPTNNFNSSVYTYPSYSDGYFTFINNGTTVNNIIGASSTYSEQVYTRIGWINLSSYSGSWSPIIQNQIGNNSDKGLTILSTGNVHFRQYTRTNNLGTTDGDYGVSSNGTVSLNQWHQVAIVVNRPLNQVAFYIDGNLDSVKSTNVIGNSASNTIVIGGAYSDSYSGSRMFKGKISAIFHYARSLSTSEINYNYLSFKGRYGL